VKGLTATHPEIPRRARGNYAALASPAVIRHLTSLGVNAIELMPVHQTAPERRLAKLGLANYWGYNSIGYFAPDVRFAASSRPGSCVAEFKSMVKGLHRAGIEVILDVVYNHTGEGDENGPTLCFRGIDNANYYRLRADGSGRCEDFTGTGNSLDLTRAPVLRMVMDSLRYWIVEMHVDGFRFDLATTLARGPRGEFGASPFLAAIAQDPVISTAKLIAEPWDVGEGGYRVGGFPVNWKEWNGRYRDGVRDFWRGAEHSMGEFASRVTGEHQFRHRARRLHARRPGFVQRQAQRGQPRGQSRRRQPQSIVELRRRGPDRRSCDSRDSRAAEAQLPRDADAVARRADDPRRRRAGPHAARQQ
jgi:isoamylase